jgi:hypothetical protein
VGSCPIAGKLAVSFLLTGFAGISDVCLSLPLVVNRTGVLKYCQYPCRRTSRPACTHWDIAQRQIYPPREWIPVSAIDRW